MANFDLAYAPLLEDEGGYVNNPNDKGKETYKGISRVFWATWDGWEIIDAYKHNVSFPTMLESDGQLQYLVKEFYRENFWEAVKGDLINNQKIANSIFNFAVNADDNVSVKLAQRAVGVKDDGIIGNGTLAAINGCSQDLFLAQFALEKIKFYIKCVERDKSQMTFFFGWVKRSVNQ